MAWSETTRAKDSRRQHGEGRADMVQVGVRRCREGRVHQQDGWLDAGQPGSNVLGVEGGDDRLRKQLRSRLTRHHDFCGRRIRNLRQRLIVRLCPVPPAILMADRQSAESVSLRSASQEICIGQRAERVHKPHLFDSGTARMQKPRRYKDQAEAFSPADGHVQPFPRQQEIEPAGGFLRRRGCH